MYIWEDNAAYIWEHNAVYFMKIQGAGNDFIIIDNTDNKIKDADLSRLAAVICQRKKSLGADGLIAIEKPQSEKADIKMNFFNSDGSSAEMCGNGARCTARFAYEKKMCGKAMNIETISGIYHAERVTNRIYEIEFMKPSMIELNRKLAIYDNLYTYTYVELGNPGIPHVLLEYKDFQETGHNILLQIAREIRYNKAFINGANVTFYDIISDDTLNIKTYERGVEDFTLACGTASVSAAVNAFIKQEVKSNNINIITDGGNISIRITSKNDYDIESIYLIGDTKLVAYGNIIDEDINIAEINI